MGASTLQPLGRRLRLLAAIGAAIAAASGCGETPPATEGGGRPDAPADESTPHRKVDTPGKLVRCLKKQRVKAEHASSQTSGDVALANAGISHETVTIGGSTDVVAYFLDDRGQVREASRCSG